MTPDPDIQDIEKVLDGDVSAFRGIVLRHQDKILRLCAGIVGDSQAEDAAQEAFLKAYNNLVRFEQKSKFSTWLYRIASNHCLDMTSKIKLKREDSLDAIVENKGESADFREAEDFVRGLEDRDTVRRLLDAVSPQARAILLLREAEGLSCDEIAETLEISLDTVKVRLFRARKALLNEARRLGLVTSARSQPSNEVKTP
ncbi:MAG: hypothetical protein A2901_06840 [Elusimicrobia bacterium RIFCSPLOWO2_01_FULL_54_10]|nr:MAG: hypothetical protein A2901_06840 [Elusimicrobia bacterium RIFCSPLOWO2_01_FULL_54_10]